MTRLDVRIDHATQQKLRRQHPRTGSHTETVRQAVDVLVLLTTAEGELVTRDGRPLHIDGSPR